MKLLLIHADWIEWEPKTKAIKMAEDVAKKKYKVNEVLVVFTAVEKPDESNPKKIVAKTVKEVVDVYKQVKAKNIVLYPYAHLSSNLAAPSLGLKIMKDMEKSLKAKKLPVTRAPFGWYKGFNLKCKGHPLSELSREILPDGEAGEEVSEAVKKEEKLKSEWFIMEPNGKTHKIQSKGKKIVGFDFSKHKNMDKFVNHEMLKRRAVDVEPPHIKMMRRLELVEYESATDPGNFRYMPKGKLVKSLIERFVTRKTIDYGAMEVETPIMYDYEHPALKDYLNRFPARQYTIQTPNKRVFLRFSACFGQFLMTHEANISYRNLPLRMYELTRYSFRVEQRGELAGLRRLRAFTMPDCHAFCEDTEQAKKEMLKRFDLARAVQDGLGLKNDDFGFAIRVVKDFFEENKEFVLKLVKRFGKPVLLEVWDKKFFYFILKHEWNFIDALGKAACLATDQIDVENAKRYEIKYTDKDNKQKYPIILHLSPSGAIERIIYALLEKAYMGEKAGKNPMLPVWLSPTQIRLCPVNDSHVKYCERIADKISKEWLRVDVDDRTDSVGRKIRDAEVEWVPISIVVGSKEKKSGKLAVRFRETGKVKQMKLENVIKYVQKETNGYPYKPLPLDRFLSKRPVFVG